MAKDKKDSLPTGALKRGGMLLKAGAKMVGRELSGKMGQAVKGLDDVKAVKRQVDHARELVRTLGEMKGAAMKAGQLLSLEASDWLPPEVVDVLRNLHDEVPGMGETDVRRLLAKEWGGDRLAQVEDLSPAPVAAASIGQVHAARIEGRRVALKIQYPGVAQSIDSDLGLLKTLVQGILKVSGKTVPLDGVFAELAQGLKREADYRLEAEALARYRAMLAGDERYLVPDVLPEWTTGKVLCMEFVEGQRLRDWLSAGPPAADRQAMAGALLDLLIQEFFVHGFMQTDPNYGNFLVRGSPRLQVALLDCGAHQAYPAEFRRLYRAFVVAAYEDDRAAAMEAGYALELMGPEEDQAVHDAFWDMVRAMIALYRPENQPCHFGDTVRLQALREQVIRFVQAVRRTAPPRKLLFLNRKLGGMFHLLKDMDVTVDMVPYWERMVTCPIAGD